MNFHKGVENLEFELAYLNTDFDEALPMELPSQSALARSFYQFKYTQ